MRRISSSLGWIGEVSQLSIIWESPWISPLHFDPFRMQISRIRVYRTCAGDESGPGPLLSILWALQHMCMEMSPPGPWRCVSTNQ